MLNIEKIFKEYYNELCFISLHYVNNLEEAEDVVQEVFVKILSQDKVKNIRNPKAYLRIAVRNTSIRYIERRKKTVQLEEEISDIPDVITSEDQAELMEKEAELYRHIKNLPEACRKVFLLCVIDGLKYYEASEKLNISVNTVKTHIRKAYKLLRESFGTIIMFMLPLKTKKM